MFEVRFTKEDLVIAVEAGTTVMEAMRMAEVSVDAPCGGEGKCGKCLVDVCFDGENWETVKSCQTGIHKDCQVRTHENAFAHKILVDGAHQDVEGKPVLDICEVVIPRCPVGESTSDWDRLCGTVQKALGEQRNFEPNLKLLSPLGAYAKSGETVEVILSGEQVLDIRKAEKAPVLMAAFDVGTTSVAGYLLDARTGGQLAVTSHLNPQTAYGGDVIMRANYALEHGVDELAACIREQLSQMIRELCSEVNLPVEAVYEICVVGNTCMHHLFLGISPDSLVHAPYNPVISESITVSAAEYQICGNPAARLIVLPVIAGFVGADTVGCLLAARMEEEEKITLMIDIGTNGELVLGNRDRKIACSTAAGPAFEGAKISCGMRGAAGAIEHAKAENGRLTYSVIGGGAPIGICGSGLIDLVNALLDLGVLDDSGRLEETEDTIIVEGKPAYLLAASEHSGNGEPVYLSQKDIREVQLAKGAMAAGVNLLVKELGLEIEDIRQVYIAGAFGNYMDPDSACGIGLIPQKLRDRIVPIGNAAGEGAKMAVLSREELKRAQRLARDTGFLELAALPEFQDEFVDELDFPER